MEDDFYKLYNKIIVHPNYIKKLVGLLSQNFTLELWHLIKSKELIHLTTQN